MRSPARRRPIRKQLGWGSGLWAGYGPMVTSGTNGFGYPERFMIRQRGVWVARQYSKGERDRPPDW